jgi:predicted DNA-binding protein (MmcQ/YjbR family)
VASTKTVKTDLRKYALTFDDTREDHPWGENVTKVKGKVFVFFGPEDDRSEGLMGVKLTRSLLYARSLPHVEAMGYGLGKSGWCTVKKPARGRVDLKLMKEWIAESYEAIASSRKASGGGRASRPGVGVTPARGTSASSGRRAGSSGT